MMPWFIWKGQNSLSDFGLWISKLPNRTRAEERHEEIEIPGRAGSLIMLEGEDVYSPYPSEMTLTARNSLDMNGILEWLRGSGQLALSTDISKCWDARITNKIDFARVGNNLQQGVISFLFQPFRKSTYPIQDKLTITGASASEINPGDVASKPKVKISGTGSNTITIDGKAMSFTGISGSIIVDCDAQIITSGNSIWTGSFTGEFWSIPTGPFTIAQTGSMTIEIDPEWRWF